MSLLFNMLSRLVIPFLPRSKHILMIVLCSQKILATISGWLQPAHLAGPRGATPRPRSGTEAGRTPCPRGGGQKELPHVQGKGQRPRVPGCDGAGTAERSYPVSEVRGGGREELLHVRPTPGAAAERTYPTPEARGRCREEQPHLQGVVAARAQESLEELFHVQSQKGQQ